MKKLFLIFLLLISNSGFSSEKFHKIDFFESLGKLQSKYADERFALYFKKNRKLTEEKMQFFKILYEKPEIYSEIPKIPKIIHQIWLGPREIPKKHLEQMQSWKKFHPNWQYKLWRESDIAEWNFENKDLFDKASSFQERADILRYEILRKYGGIYVDVDYVALKNFDHLFHHHDFLGSLEPSHKRHGDLVMTNAIIAARPNHPVFTEIFKKIRAKWDVTEKAYENGELKGNRITIAIHRCMLPLTETVFEVINPATDSAIILPPTYLMPIFPAGQLGNGGIYGKIMRFLKLQKDDGLFQKIMPESMATQDFSDHGVILDPQKPI